MEVQDKLVSALGALEDVPLDIEKAKMIPKESEEKIKEQRVANRSEHGWVTVDECVTDDSNDEKQLFV